MNGAGKNCCERIGYKELKDKQVKAVSSLLEEIMSNRAGRYTGI